MGNSSDSAAAPASPPPPPTEWRFPTGVLVGAIALALCGGAAMLEWIVLVGMSHFSGDRFDAFGYGSAALLLGSCGLFATVGARAWRVPPTLGRGVIRAAGIVSYVFAVASAAIGLWAVAMALS